MGGRRCVLDGAGPLTSSAINVSHLGWQLGLLRQVQQTQSATPRIGMVRELTYRVSRQEMRSNYVTCHKDHSVDFVIL